MTQDDDDDDEISRREKVGRSVGVELVKPASRLVVVVVCPTRAGPFARRERLTRATKRDDDDETRRYASKT
jgi:hypothetical protein